MYSSSGSVWLRNCQVQKRTDLAVLLNLADGEEVWIPMTQVVDYTESLSEGETCDVEITRWVADQKGL